MFRVVVLYYILVHNRLFQQHNIFVLLLWQPAKRPQHVCLYLMIKVPTCPLKAVIRTVGWSGLGRAEAQTSLCVDRVSATDKRAVKTNMFWVSLVTAHGNQS